MFQSDMFTKLLFVRSDVITKRTFSISHVFHQLPYFIKCITDLNIRSIINEFYLSKTKDFPAARIYYLIFIYSFYILLYEYSFYLHSLFIHSTFFPMYSIYLKLATANLIIIHIKNKNNRLKNNYNVHIKKLNINFLYM